MSTPNFKRTKFACYSAYFTMSSIFCVPPLLFVTFQQLYDVSYTLLGTLVLVNFCTQLGIDLIFTLFSKFFNPKMLVRVMPILTALGMFLFALIPTLFESYAYLGFLIGTIIFSVSAGLSEVLLSPTIAAIPSDNPQRDMSFLHSLYAFGTFTMIIFSTLFLKVFHAENWAYLMMFLGCLPIIAAVLFMLSPMPDMQGDNSTATSVKNGKKRALGLSLCFACIFFGACVECAMSTWISTYMENALGIDKALGDILGVAAFAILLGLARIAYARFGKNIGKTLLISMCGGAICYLVAGLSPNTIVCFIACCMTGFCSAMLWPGSLILMEEKVPNAGVAAFALMAAGGDLGASVAPQLTGVVVDQVAVSSFGNKLATKWNITSEQVGLKIGMLLNAVFALCGVITVLIIIRYFKKRKTAENKVELAQQNH